MPCRKDQRHGVAVTATVNSDHAVVLCIYNHKDAQVFQGSCQQGGQFLTVEGATINGSSGYWFTDGTYGYILDGSVLSASGNSFDHKWVQVNDPGRMIFDNAPSVVTHSVTVYPSNRPRRRRRSHRLNHRRVKRIFVWGSNDRWRHVARSHALGRG